MELNIEEKCRAVADGFDWYRKAAEGYLAEGNWSEGRVLFVNERYDLLERVKAGMANEGGYETFIPADVKLSKFKFTWRVALSTSVTGFRCTEYLHLLCLQGRQSNLLLYRTKDKQRVFEQGSNVKGSVWVRGKKVKFGGFDLPVASKVNLV